tara:strand:- start:166 stop:906 length:741 start_codon:yes stop_codon:yes gene_type:complete
MGSFIDQTVIVTGGTRGIGKAVTEMFLSEGAKVIVIFRSNQSAANAFCEANIEYKDNIALKQFDVADTAAVESFYREIEVSHGKVEILVNNSGIRRDSVVGMMKEEDWRAVINTNLTGTFLMSKLAVLNMMQQRYGRIVTVTSPIGHFGFAGQANYAASKAGQVAFTKSLSKEVARRGITVNCVSPGFIDTEFISDLPDEQKKAYLGQVPMKRFGTPEEVARTILFLSSRDSSYINGATLEITGGF